MINKCKIKTSSIYGTFRITVEPTWNDVINLIKKGNKSMCKLKVKYLDKELPKLKQTLNGNWIDLYTSETVEMKKGEFRIIPLGICVELPLNTEAIIAPRSSTFKNYGVIMANSLGIIDESYCGDNDVWGFPAYATQDTVILKGTRICQFRLLERQDILEFKEVETLGNDNRGGFGSTGR